VSNESYVVGLKEAFKPLLPRLRKWHFIRNTLPIALILISTVVDVCDNPAAPAARLRLEVGVDIESVLALRPSSSRRA
jgi:hypothetical protein